MRTGEPDFDLLDHETPEADLAELRRLAWLAPLTGGRKVVVEVGSWAGLTARAITDEPSVDVLFCVDHWKGSDRLESIARRVGSEEVFRTFCRNTKDRLLLQIVPLRGDSLDWAALFPHPVSMVFIDADHGKLAADVEAWGPHVTPGGILCGHDYGVFPAVTRDVDKLAQNYRVTVRGFVWSLTVPEEGFRWASRS